MSEPSVVFFVGESARCAAQELAGNLKLPRVDASEIVCEKRKLRCAFFRAEMGDNSRLAYLLDENGLKLLMLGDDLLTVQADFHGPTVNYRRTAGGGRGQMIAKAVGLKGESHPSVLDATAGLGADAFVLASLGCEVEMVERVPAVRALLADALQRGKRYAEECEPELLDILGRLSLRGGDSLSVLAEIRAGSGPDVVYLDPMFPERIKSAAVKKEMQVFHELIGADSDGDELLPIALEAARRRVVVKRPRIAPALGGLTPSHVLEGKSNRFDVYMR